MRSKGDWLRPSRLGIAVLLAAAIVAGLFALLLDSAEASSPKAPSGQEAKRARITSCGPTQTHLSVKNAWTLRAAVENISYVPLNWEDNPAYKGLQVKITIEDRVRGLKQEEYTNIRKVPPGETWNLTVVNKNGGIKIVRWDLDKIEEDYQVTLAPIRWFPGEVHVSCELRTEFHVGSESVLDRFVRDEDETLEVGLPSERSAKIGSCGPASPFVLAGTIPELLTPTSKVNNRANYLQYFGVEYWVHRDGEEIFHDGTDDVKPTAHISGEEIASVPFQSKDGHVLTWQPGTYHLDCVLWGHLLSGAYGHVASEDEQKFLETALEILGGKGGIPSFFQIVLNLVTGKARELTLLPEGQDIDSVTAVSKQDLERLQLSQYTLQHMSSSQFEVVPALWGEAQISLDGEEFRPLEQGPTLGSEGGQLTLRILTEEPLFFLPLSSLLPVGTPSITLADPNYRDSAQVARCTSPEDSPQDRRTRCWEAQFLVPANPRPPGATHRDTFQSKEYLLRVHSDQIDYKNLEWKITVGAPSELPEPGADRKALVAFYDATSGDNWQNTREEDMPWITGDDASRIKDWYGVTDPNEEDGIDEVEKLIIDEDNYIHGTMPSQLGTFNDIKELKISDQDYETSSARGLRGSIPSELGGLKSLEILTLYNNELSGAIPETLGGLSSLVHLDLAENKLSGQVPQSLGELTNLESLDLRDNGLSGQIPESLGELKNLKFLDLSENSLSGQIPASLGELAKDKYMDDDDEENDMPGTLKSVYLSGNELTGCIPSGFRDLRNDDLDNLGLPFCDVALSGLTISPGGLDDTFDATKSRFSATVGHSRITIIPELLEGGSFEVRDSGNNIAADANPLLEGHQLDLTQGESRINLRVYSPDGEDDESYRIDLRVDAGPPGVPTILSATPWPSGLNVEWAAPSFVPLGDNSGSELRYIHTNAFSKAERNWESTGSLPNYDQARREHRLDGLDDDTWYDVQVRHLIGGEPGPWSETLLARSGRPLDVFWASCYPSRLLINDRLRCSPSLVGGVPGDFFFRWTAEDASPPTGTSEKFDPFWSTPGRRSIAVQVCSGGVCDTGYDSVMVEDNIPKFSWRFVDPPAEIALGDSFELSLNITKKSLAGSPGGISVSFPSLTRGNAGGDSGAYNSEQATVETVSYTGGLQWLDYYDNRSGTTVEDENGSRGRPEYLTVATDNSIWPTYWVRPSTRTLKLNVTTGEPGEFQVLYRYWLCSPDRRICTRWPKQGDTEAPAIDQQGWEAYEFTVNVVHLPVVEALNCSPSAAESGDTVACSPRLSGGAPDTYAWNAGNALAGGAPFEGSEATFSTTWDYDGRHRITLEVCNIAGCDTGEQVLTVGTVDPDTTPEEWTLEDGARVLYSGPVSDVAADGYSPTDTTLHVVILPTAPLPTLRVTALDADGFAASAGPYTSPGALTLALPEGTWVDYDGITRELLISGEWTPFTESTQQVLLALERVLSAARRTTATVAGIVPSVSDSPLTASDRLAWALGERYLPLDDVFEERHANCLSQVTVPWLAWAVETKGVRVSVPLSLQPEDYFSMAAAFTSAQPGAPNDGKEPALAQLHDLLATGQDAPACGPPDSTSD